MRFPIALVNAPAGYGKTVALNEVLREWPARVVQYDLSRQVDSFAAFARGLAHAIGDLNPNARLSFAGAYERAAGSTSVEHHLANWLAGHLKGLNATVVIDQMHHAQELEQVSLFLTHLVELAGESAKWVFAARGDVGLPIPRWLAQGRMDMPLDAQSLQFGMDEVRDAEILRATAGWPTGVLLALHSMPVSSYDELSQHVFATCTETQRRFLLDTCMLPYLNDDICAAAGWDDARTLIDELDDSARFVFVDSGADLQYHDRFAEYLLERLRERGEAATTAVVRNTVLALESAQEAPDALRLATKYAIHDEIVRLADRHGLRMIDGGDADAVKGALEVVHLRESECTGITLAIKAVIESRAGRTDTSEAWFQLALTRVDEPIARAEIAYLYGRDLQLRRRADSIDVLEPHAAVEDLPLDLRVSLLSALAQGHLFKGQYGQAAACVRKALRIGKALRDKAALAKLHVRAAYVALYTGERVRARTLALQGARFGEEGGDFHTACGAYSTLYAIAADDDKPSLCLKYLHRIGENGAKCGDPRWQLYALIGSYEMEVERCNAEAIASLRKGLQSFDVHYATLDAMEGLLPSRALELTWSASFDEAHRLLAPTPSQQIEPDRQALRSAEVALYAAAAGDRDASRAALRDVRKALRSGTASVRAYRSELFSVLALRLLGRRRIIAKLFDSLEAKAAPSNRMSALYGVVRELCRALDGLANRQQVEVALGALRSNDAGGLAKMFLAIPMPRTAAPSKPQNALKTLEADASEFRARLLDNSVTREERTLGAAHAAGLYTARLLEFLEDGSTRALASWLNSFLERYADTEAVRQIVSHGPATLEAILRGRIPETARYREALTALDGVVRKATLRPRRRSSAPETEIVDEVDAAINGLIFKLDRADPLTAEHSRAVASWCARLARKIGLSAEEVAFASRCGLIHDVGKMTTPAEILSAPRALDDREWKIMRNHAAVGERIVRGAPLLTGFAPAVRSHHERLDGKGYPDAMAGGAIPFIARLVSVADCFNAMIGRRPYRKPMSPFIALGELERHRGGQFDPELVQAMVEIVTGK